MDSFMCVKEVLKNTIKSNMTFPKCQAETQKQHKG